MQGSKVIGIIISVAFAASILIGGAFFYLKSQNKTPEFDSVTAVVRDLIQIVAVTGNVQPVEAVDLAFEVTGRVDDIFVEVGDTVDVGDPLIKLVNTDISSELSQAIANLRNEQASLKQFEAAVEVEKALLAELERGTRDEQVQVSKTRVDNAENALKSAQIDLVNVKTVANQELESLYDQAKDEMMYAYLEIDEALNIKTEPLFSTSLSNKGNLVFSVQDPSLEAQIRDQRSDATLILGAFETVLAAFPQDQTVIDQKLDEAESDLDEIQSFLFSLIQALNDEADLSSTEKNTFLTNVNTARTDISVAQNAVSALIQSIEIQKSVNTQNVSAAENREREAQQAVTLAQDELALSEAETLPERIQSQSARVLQAEANIQSQLARITSAESQVSIVRSRLEKTILRAPIAGVITTQEAEIGEIVSLVEALAPTVISIASDEQYEIITNVPEVDIAKVNLQDHADITLDAYGGAELFSGSVVKIDPAETVIEGVPTYKVTLWFDNQDDRIKSGMTANIDIVTDQVEQVIAVPQRTIQIKNGKRMIRVFENNEVVEREVVSGLTSWDGQIEIRAGLNEGDEVITFIEE